MRSSKVCNFVLMMGLVSTLCTIAQAGPWVPLPQQTLEIKPGSALDFSDLAPTDSQGKPVPAGHFGPVRINDRGKFVFNNSPDSPVRFLASFGVSPASGFFPDAASAQRLALQLRLAGYNLVRFHMVDALLMSKTKADLVFDPVQLDRLFALLAALKKEGIYWMFDGLSSAMGGYSNSIVDKNRDQWAPSPFNVKAGLYVSDMYREHYKELAKKMFTMTNPYTGLSITDDPALAGVILVNEGGINFVVLNNGANAVRAALVGPFNQWLKRKYTNNAELKKAWGAAGAEKLDLTVESLDQENIRLPTDIYSPTPRNIDAQKFFLEQEAATAKWMTEFFRAPRAKGGLGYEGLLTSFNNWTSLEANLSRSEFSWVDLHGYFDDPTNFAETGSRIRQISSLYDPDPKLGAEGLPQRSLGYIQALAANRHAGKPFSVSEYSHVFWNAWRREGFAFAAYASLQDWDMICQFNDPVMPVRPANAPRPPRYQAIYPYQIGIDPIAKSTETLAALLFLRGDVAASTNSVVFRISTDNFQAPNSSMADAGGLRYSVAALSLLTRIGVSVGPAPDSASANIPADMLPDTWRGRVKPIQVKGTENIEQLVDSLRAKNAISNDTLTNLANSIYESDTKQLVLRAPQRSLSVITPRTEVVSFDRQPPRELKHLGIEKFDTPATVGLSSLDGKDLGNSKHMLLTISTDAINSDMKFRVTDENGAQQIKPGELTNIPERKVLQRLGHLPVLLKSTKMTLKIKNVNIQSLSVHALALNGERMAKLSAFRKVADGRALLDIDTEKTPTTYFEIAVPSRSSQ